jgi:hypothetical protein
MSAEIKTLKIACKVWCLNTDADEKNREMGFQVHDTEDTWEDYGFDLTDVMTIRRTMKKEFLEECEATTLHFYNNTTVIINLPFEEIVTKWLEINY